MRPWLRALLREPLVHFVVLGSAVLAAYAALGTDLTRKPDSIVVSRAQVEQLALGFTRTWQRPPSDAELESLIQDHVRDEVYYREAVAMGLDREDIVIRRRLRQKLEFVSEDVAALAEPSLADLEALLRSQPDRFRGEARTSFGHVYFNPEYHGDLLVPDAQKMLAKLQGYGPHARIEEIGDRFLLGSEFESATAGEITARFGEEFAQAVATAPLNAWYGPVQSGYGMHLVYVSERSEGSVPPLQEIQDTVRQQWVAAHREQAAEAFYQKLLARYAVTVESACAEAAGGLAQR
jgi:hypothetical protein